MSWRLWAFGFVANVVLGLVTTLVGAWYEGGDAELSGSYDGLVLVRSEQVPLIDVGVPLPTADAVNTVAEGLVLDYWWLQGQYAALARIILGAFQAAWLIGSVLLIGPLMVSVWRVLVELGGGLLKTLRGFLAV